MSVYRNSFAGGNNSAQLVLPESLKTLPLYVLGLVKNVAFKPGNDVRNDDRAYAMYRIRTLSCDLLQQYLYPRLYQLTGISPEVASLNSEGAVTQMPQPIQLSGANLQRNHAYLLDDGHVSVVWVGKQIDPNVMFHLFGVQQFAQISPRLPRLNNEISKQAFRIIDTLSAQRALWGRVFVVREGEPAEIIHFLDRLIEDQVRGIFSYYEFLVKLQKMVVPNK